MNDTTIDLDQAEQEILTCAVSDEVLEAAGTRQSRAAAEEKTTYSIISPFCV